ncbi:hypothetical protein [Microvirga sp. 17 mud 1-3]|uniref:hypothetical protein n=1 Tax=Microvirga sp. 17 mud 1-3 TaxID=2082949 RepID=UPI000D6C64BC|nr:hypothetical protein [Microvirga sp. 17 mud 1-3]AWM86308.1 hypothetical protein C4E04_05830 [Microvirga sp. 17 mud 1-3]
MKSVIRSAWLAGLAALPLAACNQTAAPVPSAGSVNVTPSSFRMPDGAGCKGEIDRYRAVMGNDLAMGHVNQSVYNRVEREMDQASGACAAGRDAEAIRMVNATKARYGYR